MGTSSMYEHRSGWDSEAAALDSALLFKLREELGEDAEMVAQLYLERMAVRLTELREAVAAQNEGKVKETAHLLKGSSRQMGALPLGLLAETLEREGLHPHTNLSTLLSELEHQAVETEQALRREFHLS